MKTKLQITKWVLTLLLLIGVYSETGLYTTIAIALIGISLQLIENKFHEN